MFVCPGSDLAVGRPCLCHRDLLADTQIAPATFHDCDVGGAGASFVTMLQTSAVVIPSTMKALSVPLLIAF